MVLIAHRGNTIGPNPIDENRPEYIREALEDGYNVEIDVWSMNGRLYFGHDEPRYPSYLQLLHNPGLWVHAKNLEALEYLIDAGMIHVFWHDKDLVTLTSDNYIWGFKGGTNRSIIVLQDDSIPKEKCYGVCSDYVQKIKNNTPL